MIPKEYAQQFKVNGQLLPGYTIEGEEVQKAPEAAVTPKPEVSAPVQPETVAEAPDRKGFGLSGEYLMREEEWSGEEDVRQKTGCSIVDAELCGEPIVGKWQDGDWFRPIGAPGRKKLQDWFSDRHFTIEDKRAVPILRDPEDPSHVLAIIGFAVDKSVKVSQKTKRIYRFCLIPEL